MNTHILSQAWRKITGHPMLSVVLLAALFAGLLGPLSFPSLVRAAGQLRDGQAFLNDLRGQNQHDWTVARLPSNAQAAVTPGSVYQTTYNGGEFDSGRDEVVDADGNAYIVARVYDTTNDVMIVKLSPSGSVRFVTYLRGSLTDYGTGLALDGQGGLLVSGFTNSSDFPIVNAAQPVFDARRSGFLARLSTADGSVLYSSFFGASGADEIRDLVVGSNGDIYLVGVTNSTDFPTVNAYQDHLTLVGCFCDDAFVVRLSPDARTILYSTYLGGGLDDTGSSIGLDAAGNIYLTGSTQSSDFPTVNPIQAAPGGGGDVWAARLSADGSQLDYSTYLGGSNSENITRLAVDASGQVTLAGVTNSNNFPTTAGGYQPAFGGGLCGIAGFGQRACYDAFITRLAPDGSSLVYSTYLGGGNDDDARGVVVDGAGNAYIVGFFTSTDTPPSEFDIYVAGFDPTGSQLRYYFKMWSAVANDGHGIALGPDGDVYFTGAIDVPADLFAARLSESGGTCAQPHAYQYPGSAHAHANPATLGRQPPRRGPGRRLQRLAQMDSQRADIGA